MFKSASYEPTHSSFLFRLLELSAVILYFPRSEREAFNLREAAVFLCRDGPSVVTALLRCVSGCSLRVCSPAVFPELHCLSSPHPARQQQVSLSTVAL